MATGRRVRYSSALVIRGMNLGARDMQRQDGPAILGLVIFALAAVGSAAFMFAFGQAPAYVVAGAVVLLAAGQIAALVAQWLRGRGVADSLATASRNLRTHAHDLEILSARLYDIEARLARPVPNPAEAMMQEIRTLRDSIKDLVADLAKPVVPAEVPATPQAAPAAPPAALNEQLELFLEPVIELASGATTHYRARVNLVDEQGGAVPHDALLRKADDGGIRPALDHHLLALALPVLRKLRNRNPALRVFVPLGAATLRDKEGLARIAALLEKETDAAGGIVFELPYGDLASLEPAGIDGLANLGRLGAVMALSGISIAGLDLASLRQLGVRFLAVEAPVFEAGAGAVDSWTEFSRFAKVMQFQLIASAVASAAQATAATRVARFGYGPYFAPPRRVRQDAGQQAIATRIEAA